jgi:hypothetical protein
MFALPGSLNPQGEFKQWLHVWSLDNRGRQSYNAAYPYPLVGELDGELLASHAVIHRFKHWPGHWPHFISSWGFTLQIKFDGATQHKRPIEVRLYYLLSNSPSKACVEKFGLMTFDSVSQYLMHRSLVDALK